LGQGMQYETGKSDLSQPCEGWLHRKHR
jgi:hypothetical protein